MTCLSSEAETKPLPSLSNTRKDSRSSSSVSSVFFIDLVINVRNSGKSMVPLPAKDQGKRVVEN